MVLIKFFTAVIFNVKWWKTKWYQTSFQTPSFDMHLQAEASPHPIFFNKTSQQTHL